MFKKYLKKNWNKFKNNIWPQIERWAALFAIILSVLTFWQGCDNSRNSSKQEEEINKHNEKIRELENVKVERESYLDKTNFNIVQNFWQEQPSYTLYNESEKPLTYPPQPSYYMYVPAKLFFIFENGERFSNLILLPVSYENVISQTSTGKTIYEIETSILPKNFYGKLGSRDLRSKTYGTPGVDKLAFELRVYPFLAIATHIEYSYKDSPSNIVVEKFITTPWGKETLTDSRFEDLENYTRNMVHFPENEAKINKGMNIYDSSFEYLQSQFNRLLPMLSTGFETQEDQERFYTLMGTKWDMVFDSNKDLSEYSQPSEDNFYSLGRELSDKIIPANDPLNPDY